MQKPGSWWRGKNTPAKVETYTRWSFHSFGLVEVIAIGVTPFGEVPPPLAGWLFLLVCGHAALCMTTSSRALDWKRGRRDQPVRWLAALGTVTGLAAVGVLFFVLGSPHDEARLGTAAAMNVGLLAFGVGTLAIAVRDTRRMLALLAGASAGAGLMTYLLGVPADGALITAGAVLVSSGFLGFTALFSVWLLNSVYELDAARETRTRLAIAEERLRFGRDLHDVMGRNLAVIALKSELAVQLTRRGRQEAVEQMIEVQRIAQEAQREVREVVRGYREADLTAELHGAQGVLTAAGIDCDITGNAGALPAAVQSALGWVVREATTNVLRHGNAAHCAVSLRKIDDRVVLTVENDGAPPDAAPRAGGRGSGGSGLAGLRERLTPILGTLEAGPARKGRFRVTATVPLPDRDPAPGGDPDRDPGPGAYARTTTEMTQMTHMTHMTEKDS